jgi:hypothetical protein
LPLETTATDPLTSSMRNLRTVRRGRIDPMIPLRARVRNGRLVLDEPTDAALARSAGDAQDRRVVDASYVFRKLRGGG